MTDSVWLLLAAVAMLLATGWLALSLQPHWRQVFGTDAPPSALRLRAAGWSALLAAAVCCFAADHPSMAVLVWFTLLPVAAVATAMTLSYRPALLRVVCPVFLRARSARLAR